MARINSLTNFLTDVATAIKNKKGDNTPIPANTFDTEISNLGGGNVVNGIIEQYKAESGTIDANTFVEYVNKTTVTIGTDTSLSVAYGAGSVISAVKLSDSKVFIVCQGYNDSRNYLAGLVLTISGDTIAVGNITKIANTNYAYVSAVALSDSKVFVSYSNYAVVCTIENTTITLGTRTNIVSDIRSITMLNANKVFITYCVASGDYNKYLYGLVCTIDGTTITVGTGTKLSTDNDSGNIASVVALSDSKVFIAYSSYNSGTTGRHGLGAMICTISGDTIIAGSKTNLSSSTYAGSHISAIALDNNKVFIAHTGTDNCLYGTVIKVNEDIITVGSLQYQLSSTSYSGYIISAVKLSDKKVLVAHSDNTADSGTLYGLVCSINGIKIISKTDTQLNSSTYTGHVISAVALSDTKSFIAHSVNSSRYLYGILTEIPEDTIQPSTSNIHGLTKTECSPTTAGDVFVLDESYVPHVIE